MPTTSRKDLNQKIKLVIWDLDDTFWTGSFEEGTTQINKDNIQILNKLIDRGILNSICSKNDFDKIKNYLESLNLWDLFVFPSINYTPKGKAILEILEEAQLRPENTLFIDDNLINLNEVKFYNPKINVSGPDIIPQLLYMSSLKGKNDFSRKSLSNYKLLEKKKNIKSTYDSNIEFLKSSNINVKIAEIQDEKELIRGHELIMKTNQLNFTKKRDSFDELQSKFRMKEFKFFKISVRDRFGDYGYVGIVSIDLTNNSLEHFVFSCRILDMGIENFVYNFMNKPKLDVVGEVIHNGDFSFIPDWINQKVTSKESLTDQKDKFKIFIKGGCDLSQTSHYLKFKKNIEFVEEYNYSLKDNTPVHSDHTFFLETESNLSIDDKNYLNNRYPFLDKQAFNSEIFNEEYDAVIISLLKDVTMNYYIDIESSIKFPFGSYLDYTKEKNYKYIAEKNQKKGLGKTLGINFFKKFEKSATYLGPTTPEQFESTLGYLTSKITSPIILINFAEVFREGEQQAFERHKEFNLLIDQFIRDKSNIYLVDVRKFISLENTTDSIRHYDRLTYKNISDATSAILEEILQTQNLDLENDYIQIIIANFKIFKNKTKAVIKKNLYRIKFQG